MESYIVRIYRYAQEQSIAGTVQSVEQNGKYTFSSIDELWQILKQPEDSALQETAGSAEFI